ncbi:hypothetical protein Droror1_Dr00017705 [Drosera rotundifolia]
MSSPPFHNASHSYGRLTALTPQPDPNPQTRPKTRPLLRCLATLTILLLLLATATAATSLIMKWRSQHGSDRAIKPTKVISQLCGSAWYQNLCVESLLGFPGAMKASGDELVHISVNVTLMKFGKALDLSMQIGYLEMGSLGRSAYEDCLELLDHSVDLLTRSLSSVQSKQGGTNMDVMTWLAAAVTNQDTCMEGIDGISGPARDHLAETMKDLSEMGSNSLAIFANTRKGGGNDVEHEGMIGNRRRRLLGLVPKSNGFDHPIWFTRRDRILLATPSSQIQADVIVSQGGQNGTVKTILEAINMAPVMSNRRFIIHVTAGRYVEKNLKIGRKKTNLWLVGDGRGQTVISGDRSVAHDLITTFRTASFAATGTGFVAKDITFENSAGPGEHQAVALRVGADHAVVYRCEIKGYQDTLYVHNQRQFYRECDIYGTVDFIFGNAAVVFQNCTMYAIKPLPLQKITITAQNRKDPQMCTGISIHACQIKATSDLELVKSSFPTYLGRPWKPFSRVVYMLSYIGDHVDPRGWLEWNATAPVDKLYYGEYSNYGPSASIQQRVKWPGLHANMSVSEASAFTVEQFIFGSAWLSSTGVAFQAGLSG